MQVVQDNTDHKKEQHGQSSHIVFAKRMVHSPIKNTSHEHGRQKPKRLYQEETVHPTGGDGPEGISKG